MTIEYLTKIKLDLSKEEKEAFNIVARTLADVETVMKQNELDCLSDAGDPTNMNRWIDITIIEDLAQDISDLALYDGLLLSND